ncbi:MAG TPA: sensor histidine kinase [Actinomycetota bacterium]|nr:sensor histidine kinase [Actinomycetota bacterium]
MSRGRPILVGLAGAGGASLAAAVVLPYRFAHPYWTALLFLLLQPIPIFAVGVAAYRKAPEHPTARRLLAVGLLYGVSLGVESLMGFLFAGGGPFRGLRALDLLATSSDLCALIFATRLFALFPSGRYERRYERIVLRAVWLLALVPLVVILASPTLAFPANVWTSTHAVGGPVAFAGLKQLGSVARGLYEGRIQLLFVGLVLLLLRFRRSPTEQRQQIKWVLYAVALMGTLQAVAALLGVAGLLSDSTLKQISPYLNDPILTFTLASTAFALFRHRLLDVDLVIRKSVVYGALWLLIGAAYVAAAAGLGVAAGRRLPLGAAILLTIAATLGFQPVRRRLEGVAGTMVFGIRLSGTELLARFGETIEHAFDLGELGPRIAAEVRDGLVLRWARVLLDLRGDGAMISAAGAAGIGLDEAGVPQVVIPLTHAGERLGAIECGPKAEGKLTAADHDLLATIARQASLGIHNGRLAAELSARLDEIRRQAEELAASRTRIIRAQDAERRRIERNIHDGVQQELVALVANLRLARNQLRRDPALADATLEHLQLEARQTLGELRELGQGIHPSVLTDRGLLEAVVSRAAHMPIGVAVEAPGDVRGARFADEVEGAAYFVVSEGLANVLKHAGATRAVVRLSRVGDRLVVEVSDDGVGFVPAEAAGSGLTGLRDRVEAVSGTLRVTSRPGEGTTLSIDLPARIREPSRA